MITQKVSKEYKRVRRQFGSAQVCLAFVKDKVFCDSRHSWTDHNGAEYYCDDQIRVRFIPDEISQYDDLAGDIFNPEHASTVDGGLRTIKSQEREFDRSIERDGVWGWQIQKCCRECRAEKHVDSCWGFIGAPPEESYIPELAMAIREYEYSRNVS